MSRLYAPHGCRQSSITQFSLEIGAPVFYEIIKNEFEGKTQSK